MGEPCIHCAKKPVTKSYSTYVQNKQILRQEVEYWLLRAGGEGGMEFSADADGVSSWLTKVFSSLILAIVVPFCEYTRN